MRRWINIVVNSLLKTFFLLNGHLHCTTTPRLNYTEYDWVLLIFSLKPTLKTTNDCVEEKREFL